jgi:hypothetical protein
MPEEQDPLEIPIPREKESDDMAASERAAEAMEANIVNGAAGAVFCLEQGRLAHLSGVIGSREALSHRIITESGGGQTRSQQPAGQGGTPT